MKLPFLNLWAEGFKGQLARMDATGAGKWALGAALVAIIAHAGFIPGQSGAVWSAKAINYDDPQVLEVLETSSVRDIIAGPTYYAYKPVYFLSLKVDHVVADLLGLDVVTLAKLMNLLLHGLCVAVLVVLLANALGHIWIAGAAGLLFAVHPVHVESVAWLSERKDVLSLLCVLWAHWSWRMRRQEGRGRWLVPAIWLALGGLTKGTVWSYAGVILLDELLWARTREDASLGKAFRTWLPLGLVGVGGVVLDVLVGANAGPGAVRHDATTPELIAAMLGVHARYLFNVIWPSGLALDYAIDPAGSWSSAWTVAGALLLIGWLALLFVSWRKGFALGVLAAALWLGGLLPVNNIWPKTSVLMADRYLHWPAIGVYLLAVWGLLRLQSWKAPVFGLIVIVLGVACVQRTRAFASSEAVWTDTLASVPSSGLAHIQRGQDRTARLLYKQAIEDADKGLELTRRPELRIRARLVRCAALLGLAGEDLARAPRRIRQLGDEARAALREIAALPDTALVRTERSGVASEAEVFLGNALQADGLSAAALEAFDRASRLDPDNGIALYNYATSLTRLGEPDALEEAVLILRRAITLLRDTPTHELALIQLATVHARQGDQAGALRELGRTMRLYPESVEALYAEARIRLEARSEVTKAKELLAQIRRIDPDHRKAARLQADLYLAEGKAYLRKAMQESDPEATSRALAKFDLAVEADPRYWEAYVAAGDALFEKGQFPEARERYGKARRIERSLRWVTQLIARSHVLEAAWLDRYGTSDAQSVHAAKVMAAGVRLDVGRIDLGFTPYTMELPLLRELAEAWQETEKEDHYEAGAVLRAAAHLCSGDRGRAMQQLRPVLSNRSEEARPRAIFDAALLLRGLVYQGRTQLDAARRDFERVATRRPDDPVPSLHKLRLSLRVAGARLQTAEADTDDMDRLERARTTYRGRLDAIRAFADANPGMVQAGLAAAEADLAQSRWTPALRRLNELAERFPEEPSVYRGRSAVYLAQRLQTPDGEMARHLIKLGSRELQKALQLDPRDVRTYLDASGLARTAQDLRSALRHARAAWHLEIHRQGPAARELSDLLVAMGRKALEARTLEEVTRYADEARKVAPGRVGPWLLEAERALSTPSQSRLLDAEKLVNKAVGLEPLHPDIPPLLGRIHREMGIVAVTRMGLIREPRNPAEDRDGNPSAAFKALSVKEQGELVQKYQAAKERVREKRSQYRQTGLRYLDSALSLLEKGSDEWLAVKDRIDALRTSDPDLRAEQERRAVQVHAARGRQLRRQGDIAGALDAYLEAVAAYPAFTGAHLRVAECVNLLLHDWDWKDEKRFRRGNSLVNVAFLSLHSLDRLDMEGAYLERHYHRGELQDRLLTGGQGGEEVKSAAIKAYETYIGQVVAWLADEESKPVLPDPPPEDYKRGEYRVPERRLEFRRGLVQRAKAKLRALRGS